MSNAGGMKNQDFRPISSFMSEMVRNAVLISTIFNDLQ